MSNINMKIIVTFYAKSSKNAVFCPFSTLIFTDIFLGYYQQTEVIKFVIIAKFDFVHL